MTAVFADTNIVVYAYAGDPEKSAIAEAIVKIAPVISTQIVNAFLSVARMKMGFDLPTRHKVAQELLHGCPVVSLDAHIVMRAMEIESKYKICYWDALVVAAALAAGCTTLCFEDMQVGQVFENRLTVRNPFLG